MLKHWAACAFACVLIAILPARLAAQTPSSADDLSKWGLYARLAGQSMKDVDPKGLRLHWRWETPGQVLLEEWWHGSATEADKPAYVMTIRLGTQPGTLNLKSSSMMGKEWVGTVQADGSVSFVGKGMLKMPYSVRLNEQGAYLQSDTRGHTYTYVAVADAATPAVLAEASPQPTPSPQANPSSQPDLAPQPAQTPVVATAPSAPVEAEKSAPVVARQDPLPPAPPIRAPRKLSEADLARLDDSVQRSRARSLEQARVNELQRQEAARQAQLQAQVWAAAEAQRQAEEAEADAEFEAERARKAAAWQQSAQASEQALTNSTARLQATTANIQAQQAEAAARQRAQAEEAGRVERQRQVELIRQANQRQDEEAARLAAQRQQYEQQRAAEQAAARDRTQQQRSAGEVAGPGRASTDTDANRCVSRSELREDDTFKGNTAAYVVNGCGTPVDVQVCLMTESGWKCGVTWGLAPQGSWSYSAFRATGGVFVDAKTAGSSRRLASPN